MNWKKIDWNILVLPDQCSRTFWAFSRYRYRDTIITVFLPRLLRAPKHRGNSQITRAKLVHPGIKVTKTGALLTDNRSHSQPVKSLVARTVWDEALSWTRTKSFWKVALTHARHTSVSCRLAQPTHVCQLIRWHKDRHYHLLPEHRHQCASHPAAYAPVPELVQLCDSTWNSSVKIHCRQFRWWMSQTRWRPAHWQRRRRCIEVTLG